MTEQREAAGQPDQRGPYPDGALEHLRQADSVLARLIDTFGVVTRELDRPPFYALLAAIVSQQISVKAAASIMERLLALLSEDRSIGPQAILAAPHERLRSAGLSAAKVRAIQDLAEKVRDGVVDLERLPHMADDQVIAVLCQARGIGRWTAEMALIFSLGRLDVLPVADLGLRASIQRNYGLATLPDVATIQELAAPWRPYRTIATIYLWESLHRTPLAR